MTLPVLVLFFLRLAGCVTPVSGTPPIALLFVGIFWVCAIWVCTGAAVCSFCNCFVGGAKAIWFGARE